MQKMCWSSRSNCQKLYAAFPSLCNGQIVNVKYRSMDKEFFQAGLRRTSEPQPFVPSMYKAAVTQALMRCKLWSLSDLPCLLSTCMGCASCDTRCECACFPLALPEPQASEWTAAHVTLWQHFIMN